MNGIAGGTKQVSNHSGLGGGYFDDRLGGLYRNQNLVSFDLITFLNMPFDDLGLGQAFAQIGQFEIFHPEYSMVSLTAMRMSSTSGRYSCSLR